VRACAFRFAVAIAFFTASITAVQEALTSSEPSALTIYNDNFVAVRTTVPLKLTPGMNDVTTTQVTTQLEPDFVVLRNPRSQNAQGHAATFRIREQNYDSGVATQEWLLWKLEGRAIDFQLTPAQTVASSAGSASMRFIFIAATGETFATRAVALMLLAMPLFAILTTVFTSALIPNRVCHHVESLDWSGRVVACDDQFAESRYPFGGMISNDDAEAGTGMQRRREWIVDQLPMWALAFELDTGHIQNAVTHIANGNCALRAGTGFHSSKAC